MVRALEIKCLERRTFGNQMFALSSKRDFSRFWGSRYWERRFDVRDFSRFLGSRCQDRNKNPPPLDPESNVLTTWPIATSIESEIAGIDR